MKNKAVIVIQSSGKYVYDFADNGKGKQIPLFGEDISKAKIYDISSSDTELMKDIKMLFAVLASCVVQNYWEMINIISL